MKISVYDEQLNRVLFVDEFYKSCLWAEGYNSTQNFTLELENAGLYKNKIKTDYYIGRDDRKTLMVVKTVKINDGNIVASGKQATKVLDDVAFDGTIKEGSQVDTSVKSAYNESSKFPIVEFKETDIKANYDGQISNKSFLKLIETMCKGADLGIRSIKSGKNIIMEFYKPEKKPNLIFSEKFGNLSMKDISLSTENYKNVAIVLGEGEGELRRRVEVDNSNGLVRRELIVDARDLQWEDNETEEEYLEKLRSRGVEKLLDSNKAFNCSFSPLSKGFGSLYELGDILTVKLEDYGLTFESRVTKFSEKSQNNKSEITVSVGEITNVRRGY